MLYISITIIFFNEAIELVSIHETDKLWENVIIFVHKSNWNLTAKIRNFIRFSKFWLYFTNFQWFQRTFFNLFGTAVTRTTSFVIDLLLIWSCWLLPVFIAGMILVSCMKQHQRICFQWFITEVMVDSCYWLRRNVNPWNATLTEKIEGEGIYVIKIREIAVYLQRKNAKYCGFLFF